jgi:hypothetical protein
MEWVVASTVPPVGVNQRGYPPTDCKDQNLAPGMGV